MLTLEQEETMELVKHETSREERELTKAMATIQESVATPPPLNLVRRSGRLVDGEALDLESAMETLKVGMLRTLERADKLRGSTLRRVIEILSPVKKVKFPAASAEFQLRVRKWGLQKNQQREIELG
ncbi:protein DOG1-like 4 [Durio zibethinus]|uniref:Protein DOG1-like 4 n=1 Tax=Durio zibethinus TaxID=66656 RepID=A0A6P6B513_DURZI|nr:protein DOG1-like 4 [Durio zibethinus]